MDALTSLAGKGVHGGWFGKLEGFWKVCIDHIRS